MGLGGVIKVFFKSRAPDSSYNLQKSSIERPKMAILRFYMTLILGDVYDVGRRRADSRDLIKRVYFAMKLQISPLSARCP